MKPIIAALLALPMAAAAVAQDTGPLEVDVVGGIQAPMAIAVPAMPSADGDVAVGRQIAEIIRPTCARPACSRRSAPAALPATARPRHRNPVYATWRKRGRRRAGRRAMSKPAPTGA